MGWVNNFSDSLKAGYVIVVPQRLDSRFFNSSKLVGNPLFI